MMRKVLLLVAAAWAISLTGCDLYFGPGSTSDCDWGCNDPWIEPPPVVPGADCLSDFECAAGCYCAFQNADRNTPGTCVETGFCDSSADCADGFSCDARATCIPATDPGSSCLEVGCPEGTYCGDTGECLPSLGCRTDADCGPNAQCAPDGTCVPVSCASNDECLAGCYCDSNGVCQETGFCQVDADCSAQCDADGANCDPMVCDTSRGTCIPGEPPPASSCGGPLTCAVAAPVCPQGETPEIQNECYTGGCLVVAECDTAPLALCDRIQNPNQCINRPDCEIHYDGYDCTCGGNPCDCTSPPLDENGVPLACTCSTWEQSCQSI